jgi:hypothetical protein
MPLPMELEYDLIRSARNPKGCQKVAGGRQAFEATSGQSFNPPLHLEEVPDIFAE